ncbi:hypothetical protein BZG36_05470 [Bifiguratus adelaidae]|uniref:MYND-type domain-containing protein n=1 Tax=Bifiguratus adelaidae TaxID=1938954 RepID=A0A261XTB7_9FUNG|nr:hypothetical protein BZG36_05470 [Bifiguratus adelaidae]
MRESNFCFPSQNRASISISSTLYDRRALDCTSDLPLVNSLTHLVYLTSTSPRIREILTLDGGLERLIRIIKTTSVIDRRTAWKWNLAFQSVANVGVRGTEQIRTRVVEAGAIPIIIDVLQNFLSVLDRVRTEKAKQQVKGPPSASDIENSTVEVSMQDVETANTSSYTRQEDPTLATSMSLVGHTETDSDNPDGAQIDITDMSSLAFPPITPDTTARTSLFRGHEPSTSTSQPLTSSSESSFMIENQVGRTQTSNDLMGELEANLVTSPRPMSIHEVEIDGEDVSGASPMEGSEDPIEGKLRLGEPSPVQLPTPELLYTLPSMPDLPLDHSPAARAMRRAFRRARRLAAWRGQLPPTFNAPPTVRNSVHQSSTLYPVPANVDSTVLPTTTTTDRTGSSEFRTVPDNMLHREEDILLSLQLLAYLSKYHHLRVHFHQSYPPHNVFSIVEKFTHKLHPTAIRYWSGVIMRNACRKDESRGGIRQCAYMKCGRWERFPREFAKCRRCRKAKYCSKTCQSKAWSEGHRWWCVERTHHNPADDGHALSTPTPPNVAQPGVLDQMAADGHVFHARPQTAGNTVRSRGNHDHPAQSAAPTQSDPPTARRSPHQHRIPLPLPIGNIHGHEDAAVTTPTNDIATSPDQFNNAMPTAVPGNVNVVDTEGFMGMSVGMVAVGEEVGMLDDDDMRGGRGRGLVMDREQDEQRRMALELEP